MFDSLRLSWLPSMPRGKVDDAEQLKGVSGVGGFLLMPARPSQSRGGWGKCRAASDVAGN